MLPARKHFDIDSGLKNLTHNFNHLISHWRNVAWRPRKKAKAQ